MRKNNIILRAKKRKTDIWWWFSSVVSGIEGNPVTFGFIESRGVWWEEWLEDFAFRFILLDANGFAFAWCRTWECNDNVNDQKMTKEKKRQNDKKPLRLLQEHVRYKNYSYNQLGDSLKLF